MSAHVFNIHSGVGVTPVICGFVKVWCRWCNIDLYSASSRTPLTRSDMDHTLYPANNTILAFTRKHPQAAPPCIYMHSEPLSSTYYSFIDPMRMNGWVVCRVCSVCCFMADVFDVQNTMNGKNLQVTASTFMPSQGKLACGRTDGSIILVPAVETIVLHLLDGGQELGQSVLQFLKTTLIDYVNYFLDNQHNT